MGYVKVCLHHFTDNGHKFMEVALMVILVFPPLNKP